MLDNSQQFLKTLPNKPGVYQMYDMHHKVLYVGKAKNLKKRLRSYFYSVNNPKTIAFMEQVKDIEIIITENENAALLLESNLIKKLKPHYNILFKDDKSFPYLLLSAHDFPRLSICRNSKLKGKYFGPFPSTKAVNFIYNLLQKIFHLRICQDSYLRNRTRPCMLHQIKLCDAPCVGLIDKEKYAAQVELASQFLSNNNEVVVENITSLMDAAAARLDYEQAAHYRDQIASVRKIQLEQAITKNTGNYDVIALVVGDDNAVGIDVLFVRNGLLLGNNSYFPVIQALNGSFTEILTAFIMQHYLHSEVSDVAVDKILVNVKLADRLSMAALLSEKLKRKIVITDRVGNVTKKLITMAETNACNALKTRQMSAMKYSEMLLKFKNFFHLAEVPQRIECFDVSHTMGEAQIAVGVVFNTAGASKSDYRKFNIKTTNVGDDYGALREALLRRYSDLKNLPDVLMIDGGKGQLNVAWQVLQRLQIKNIALMAIAKGRERKPGLEEIYMIGSNGPIVFSSQDPVLHFIQLIRDEAHRFAISGHRKKMIKLKKQSILENVAGIGEKKRMILLKHFGGLAELKSVGIEDLAKVKGIGSYLAKRIYEYLHAG